MTWPEDTHDVITYRRALLEIDVIMWERRNRNFGLRPLGRLVGRSQATKSSVADATGPDESTVAAGSASRTGCLT